VIVCGLSGSGKSTVARQLHRRTGFAHFNSDVIRKKLAGIPVTSRERARDNAGLYSAEHSARTYEHMLALAAAELKAGHGAIVDATFLHRGNRDAARAVATAVDAGIIFVECACNSEEAIRRLRARAAEGRDPSDADEEIYQLQRAAYEPFGDEERSEKIEVATSASLATVMPPVERAIRERSEARVCAVK
jgi:predicted kinase